MTHNANSKPVRRLNRFCKPGPIDRARRYGDAVIASIILLMLAPLFLFVAAAIKLEDGGPIFVRRTCIGRGGRIDKLGFRTTIHDPAKSTPVWAQRVTSVGEFLQLTRIDNLPQIVNVLRGDLSLIDPDADLASFLD